MHRPGAVPGGRGGPGRGVRRGSEAMDPSGVVGGGGGVGPAVKRQKKDKGNITPEVVPMTGPVLVREPADEEERREVEK